MLQLFFPQTETALPQRCFHENTMDSRYSKEWQEDYENIASTRKKH